MKSLIEYIDEHVEWTPDSENGTRGVMTLVRRENLDLSTISEEDFVKFMLEDYKKAVEEYTKICKPINARIMTKRLEEETKRAIKFAEKTWKTQKRRDKYIETIRKNIQDQTYFLEDPKHIFFDLQPEAGVSIPQCCIINSKSNEESLKEAYEHMQHSKFFKKGIGWAFKYGADNKDRNFSSRPYVDILMNESDKAEQKRNEEILANAVTQFYSNSNYWGD